MGIVVVARFAAIAPLVCDTTITSTGIRIRLASGSVYCPASPDDQRTSRRTVCPST